MIIRRIMQVNTHLAGWGDKKKNQGIKKDEKEQKKQHIPPVFNARFSPTIPLLPPRRLPTCNGYDDVYDGSAVSVVRERVLGGSVFGVDLIRVTCCG